MSNAGQTNSNRPLIGNGMNGNLLHPAAHSTSSLSAFIDDTVASGRRDLDDVDGARSRYRHRAHGAGGDRSRFERFACDESGMHAMPMIGNPKSPIFRRIIWLLLVLAAAGILTYMIQDRVGKYRRFETTTNVVLKYEKNLSFPAVTVCNFNPFYQSLVNDTIDFAVLSLIRSNLVDSSVRELGRATARTIPRDEIRQRPSDNTRNTGGPLAQNSPALGGDAQQRNRRQAATGRAPTAATTKKASVTTKQATAAATTVKQATSKATTKSPGTAGKTTKPRNAGAASATTAAAAVTSRAAAAATTRAKATGRQTDASTQGQGRSTPTPIPTQQQQQQQQSTPRATRNGNQAATASPGQGQGQQQGGQGQGQGGQQQQGSDGQQSRLSSELRQILQNESALVSLLEPVDVGQYTLEKGMQLDRLLESCTFRGTECNASDFQHVFTTFGSCYTFNPDETRQVSQAGQGHGLDLILNIEEDEYISGVDQSVGVRVLLHSSGESPHTTVDSLGFAAAPGETTLVGISRRQVTNLDRPYNANGCRSNTGEDKLKYFDQYTLSNCALECFADLSELVCGCRAPYMPSNDNSTVCNPIQMFRCIDEVKTAIIQGTNQTFDCAAQQNCVQPCEYSAYSYVLSSATYPSTRSVISPALTQAEEAALLSTKRRNYVHLNMYYEELNYQKVEQVIAYDWLSLVSEIGGLAGILLGASVLTFLEFLDFVTGSILCAIYDVSHRRRYNAQRKSSFQGNVELTTNWSLEPPPNT